jgi:competence protein ComGC
MAIAAFLLCFLVVVVPLVVISVLQFIQVPALSTSKVSRDQVCSTLQLIEPDDPGCGGGGEGVI